MRKWKQLGTLGDLPKVVMRLDEMRRSVPDMQTPAFWRQVWSVDRNSAR